MKRTIFSIFILMSSIFFGQNQKLKPTRIETIKRVDTQFYGYDSFGYLYWMRNNVFTKNKGKESQEYQNVSLGKIKKAVIQNPLQIILFYENFNTVVLLDNQFNESQRINFSENETPIVLKTIGLASQNQLWVYNSLNQKIGLFDYLKKEYRDLSTPFKENFKYSQMDFNYFQWIDEANNWYRCDIYGKIKNLGKVSDFELIYFLNSTQLLYCKDNLIRIEDLETKQKYEIEISEKTIENFSYKDQILSIFTSQGITNYKIILP
jgi:hypothetical protein